MPGMRSSRKRQRREIRPAFMSGLILRETPNHANHPDDLWRAHGHDHASHFHDRQCVSDHLDVEPRIAGSRQDSKPSTTWPISSTAA